MRNTLCLPRTMGDCPYYRDLDKKQQENSLKPRWHKGYTLLK